jgi:hypothetical protein
MMKPLAITALLCVSVAGPTGSAGSPPNPAQGPPTYAQQLVNQMLAAHTELAAMELALQTAEGCKTVAATDLKDVGEKCDDDELGPMRTGEPDVEEPTKDDPVYDITQALHDSAGTLIGAVGMDLKPAPGKDRAAMVAQARAILRELEARIPSKQKLLLAQ